MHVQYYLFPVLTVFWWAKPALILMNSGRLLRLQAKYIINLRNTRMSEMLHILLVVQVIIAVSMICVILLQRSSSDGLSGLSGGSGGGNSLVSGRASANMLTKTTAYLAVAFMANSLAMATITARGTKTVDRVIENISTENNASDIGESGEVKEIEPTVPVSE
ncbi:MAG: preprotein translocase subunit SecG [Alphaproteobacteria bacterium CG11_big_fil_rev_8_21_14_0_20_39_49]|nr:MAG: preprotein translocase subunit SecG [Alphaproteobacteria bacterium CG11_big_fil_rev_8_21_14_0_20_39_49]